MVLQFLIALGVLAIASSALVKAATALGLPRSVVTLLASVMMT